MHGETVKIKLSLLISNILKCSSSNLCRANHKTCCISASQRKYEKLKSIRKWKIWWEGNQWKCQLRSF